MTKSRRVRFDTIRSGGEELQMPKNFWLKPEANKHHVKTGENLLKILKHTLKKGVERSLT